MLATVSDRKVQVGSGSTLSYYTADVVSAQDYYPFGMLQPGRTFNAGGYRYGFNGKENDNEVKGEGNSVDFGARIYDPRVGRFLSVDPLNHGYPSLSPYLYALNNPIVMIDREGQNAEISIIRNKDGGGVIKVSTVIYVKGQVAEWRINQTANAQLKKTYTSQSVNVEGKVWNIQYDIRFQYDNKFDERTLKGKDNVFEVDPKVPTDGPFRTGVPRDKNNFGSIALAHSKQPEVLAHEVGHLIGFEDRYTELRSDGPEFEAYLRTKYNTKEDLAPGGMLSVLILEARKQKLVEVLNSEGYENNEMSDGKGGFTDEQNSALVNKAISISVGKDGTYILKGMFDTKGKPSQESLNKTFKSFEEKIKSATAGNKD